MTNTKFKAGDRVTNCGGDPVDWNKDKGTVKGEVGDGCFWVQWDGRTGQSPCLPDNLRLILQTSKLM